MRWEGVSGVEPEPRLERNGRPEAIGSLSKARPRELYSAFQNTTGKGETMSRCRHGVYLAGGRDPHGCTLCCQYVWMPVKEYLRRSGASTLPFYLRPNEHGKVWVRVQVGLREPREQRG